MPALWGRARFFALLLGAAALTLSGWASADPPSRVARLGYAAGAVSFSPAGEDDWIQARVNRPLTTGDRLWADAGARAELQVGGAVIRINEASGVSILNLDDRVAQLELTQGSLNVRVSRLEPGQVFEIDTPNLAFVLSQPGEFRMDVDPDGDATSIAVRSGRGEVYGDDTAYTIDSRQAYRFTGTDLRQSGYVDARRFDEFDRWSAERDRRGAVSARYVSPYVIGYEDLDEYGSWRTAPGYGSVWMPSRVAADWAPYRDGHWAWVDPWGWTWVDDAPWGFAVSHYGRWARIGGSWGWIPGPVRSRPVYAPALVAFVGGSNFQISISLGSVAGIAWFPLGPRDVYRPSYPVSRRYFTNVNTSNTTINTTNIVNVYNNVNVRNITYVNQQVPGAIVAVPRTAFVQSQPVGRAAVRLSREAVASAPVMAVAEVAPIQASVHGAAAPARRPPAEARRRPVVAKASPPPAPVPFAARQPALAAQPGRPLDAAGQAAVKPASPAPAPSVRIVSPDRRAVAPPRQQADAPARQRAPVSREAPQPPAIVPAPAEAPKAPQRPSVQEAPKAPDAQRVPEVRDMPRRPQRPEAQEVPRAPAVVPKAPEPPKAPAVVPQAPDAQRVPEARDMPRRPQRPEAQEVPRAPAVVPKAPEPPKAPAMVPKAPEPPKAPAMVPKAPEPPKAPAMVPRPPEAQKAPSPRPDAAKPTEKGEVRKSDAQRRFEERLKREDRQKLDERLKHEEDARRRNP